MGAVLSAKQCADVTRYRLEIKSLTRAVLSPGRHINGDAFDTGLRNRAAYSNGTAAADIGVAAGKTPATNSDPNITVVSLAHASEQDSVCAELGCFLLHVVNRFVCSRS